MKWIESRLAMVLENDVKHIEIEEITLGMFNQTSIGYRIVATICDSRFTRSEEKIVVLDEFITNDQDNILWQKELAIHELKKIIKQFEDGESGDRE